MIATRGCTIETPLGRFTLLARTADAAEIEACWDPTAEQLALASCPRLDEIGRRVLDLLEGGAPEFADVPTPAGPAFHRRCWEACRTIEPGEVVTYAELARRAGAPAAARAAGQAMRRNPLPIVVPCHRVVGARGLVGYGGATEPACLNLRRKSWLLEIESPRRPARAGFSEP